MGRPWYTYVLLFVGILALLGAVFRPTIGATNVSPGARVGADQRLQVSPDSPMARAGARSGDRFLSADTVTVRTGPERPGELDWRRGVPRSGPVRLERAGKPLSVEVRPAPASGLVRLSWGIVGLLNTGLVALALALFWQHPRDLHAHLLGLVLLTAPVFAFPREPRLFAVALAAHFFATLPRAGEAPTGLRRQWKLLLKLYLPLLFFGLVGISMWEEGKVTQATGLFNVVALAYAAWGIWKVRSRWRGAAGAEQPVRKTLLLAAGAVLAAVCVGISQQWWIVSDQFVPANLLPALLFSAAVARLVFRLRTVEVRLAARRTLQYLFARWTLGTLFLVPGFLLVWTMGQLSVSKEPARQDDVLGYLIWMFLTALLLGKRQQVLRNLDRRFFRDAEATREELIRLARDLGVQPDAESVVARLTGGVSRALRPLSVRWIPGPDAPPEGEMSLPVTRGDAAEGWLLLGPKESGQPYTTEERHLLEAAAVQAAMALENARLSAALLARQREELAAQSAGVLRGAEEERRRLAADLHDQVLPELRQIAAEVEALKPRANGLAPDLERLESDVRASMDSVREVMEALRPSALDMLGLADALESYLRKGAARRVPPLTAAVVREGPEPDLTPDQSLGLYRICQEAINNTLKHSGARRAGLEIRNDGRELALVLWDDGCGLSGDPEGTGRGLGNMRYRAELIGAAVSWSAPPEGGTRVEIRFPLGMEPTPGPGGATAPEPAHGRE